MFKMKNKIFTILILGMFLISLASASNLGVFKKNDCVELYQLCESCTFVNLTSVKLPNETRIFGELMNDFGNDFTFEFCNTSLLGGYQYNVCGDKGGVLTCENIDFTITKSGFIFETPDSILFTVIIIGSFLLFIFFFWLALVIPFFNETNNDNNIVKVTSYKYFKIFSIWFAHAFFVFFLTTLLAIVNNFTNIEATVKLVEFLYRIFYVLLYPMTIFILSLFTILIYKDILWNKEVRKHGKAFVNSKV